MNDAALPTSALAEPVKPAAAAEQGSPMAAAGSPPVAAPKRRAGSGLVLRYLLYLVGLVGLVLALNSGVNAWLSYNQTRDAQARLQDEKADAAAQRIGEFIAEIERQIGWTTHVQWDLGTVDQRRVDYIRLLRQVPAISELIQLDREGNEQLKVSRLSVDVVNSGQDYSKDPRFTEALAQRVRFSPVYFRKESEPFLTLSVARGGRNPGVTIAEVNLKLIWDVITTIRMGERGYAYVVDGEGRLIAHPDISQVLRNSDFSALPQVAAATARASTPAARRDEPPTIDGRDPAGRPVISASAAIPRLKWLVFVELPAREALAPLYAALYQNLLLLLGGLVLAALSALMLARRMTAPILDLSAGAARLGGGDLAHRIAPPRGSGAEIATLARNFNLMGERLQESYAGLEAKVEARTKELAEALEYQTATGDVLGVISRSPTQLQPVLDTIVATALRLCEARYGLVLRRGSDGRYHLAASAQADASFLEWVRTHPIAAGDGSAVGIVAAEMRTVHLPDALADPRFTDFDRQKQSKARTMLGVPLMREGTIVGVIFLARVEVKPFTERQIDLVTTFADQAVIAIENARLFEEVQARTREVSEALEQQKASADILGVISGSVSDAKPVFDKILDSCKHIFGSDETAILLVDDRDSVTLGAYVGAFAADVAATFPAPLEKSMAGLAIRERRVAHYPDIVNDPRATRAVRRLSEAAGYQSMAYAPMIWKGRGIGAVGVSRRAGVFAGKELALLQTFADQAVIAIQNARLFNETQEALARQTASADILRVISQSPTDVAPVFNAIVQAAMRLLACDMAAVFRRDGKTYSPVAGATPDNPRAPMGPSDVPIDPDQTFPSRAIVSRSMVHVPDWSAIALPAFEQKVHEAIGVNATLHLPLMRGDECLGVLGFGYLKAHEFSAKDIALAESFRDQAVIAIENTRLFDELQTRQKELTESLEYQTATSEVLGVISRSPSQVQPVLDAIVATAARLCQGEHATAFRLQGDELHLVAHNKVDSALVEHLAHNAVAVDPSTAPGRAVLQRCVIHVPDIAADVTYAGRLARLANTRSILAVPLLRDGAPIGVITMGRGEVQPFTEKQIDLVQTFADQAVIAIENARLFEEVQARTRELTQSVQELKALGETSQAVSGTLDLRAVLDTIVSRALDLGGADACAIFRYRKAERKFLLWRASGLVDAYVEGIAAIDIREAETAMGTAVREGRPAEIADLQQGPQFPLREISLASGYRSVLIVPLKRAGRVFGAMTLLRKRAGAFPPSTAEVLLTFANQSVLAIQNARLFRDIEDKSRQLELASQHKSQFLANMSHELRTPLNAVLGYAEMLADGLYGALPDKANTVLQRIQTNGKHLLELINDVLDLSKIEAGQLNLSLGDYAVGPMVEAVKIATESLAGAKGLALETKVAPGLPLGHGDERRLTQVLLNLVGNAIKFTDAGKVAIEVSLDGGDFEIAVTDTGPGIAPEDQARIFEKFQQVDDSSTRRKGGTGLGLAISRQIVEMHGGALDVSSVVGQGSTFRVRLPVRAEEEASEAA